MATASFRRHRKRKLKAEINVVPYIDVMLVLLIIFMVTAPLLNVGVDVNLPQADAKTLETNKKEPVVVQVLEGEGAIAKNREVMGATDPAAAAEGTIRKEFALSKGENSVHGSDSEASAAREIAFFFSGLELVG
mgnify:CR=1 FL=1